MDHSTLDLLRVEFHAKQLVYMFILVQVLMVCKPKSLVLTGWVRLEGSPFIMSVGGGLLTLTQPDC